MLRIDFDLTKDASNRLKHGVSLAAAVDLEWDEAVVWIDARRDYGEPRMIALAPKSGVLYYAVFVDRQDARRMISLRRANRREATYYVKASEKDSD